VTAGANEPPSFSATDFYGLKTPNQINAPIGISIFFDIDVDRVMNPP
jgi:hypothetical protein